jgi:hypothetical protein
MGSGFIIKVKISGQPLTTLEHFVILANKLYSMTDHLGEGSGCKPGNESLRNKGKI